MEGHTGVWLLAALLVAALISAEAQNTPSYCEVGRELVLKPEPDSGRITSIVWKFKGGIVGEWAEGKQKLEYSSRFQGRASVNTTTGELEIFNMTVDDCGLYKVEINNNVQDGGYEVIKQVPKPSLQISTNEDSDSRFLSCDGDIKGAEPVTFYWEKGDGKWEKGEQNMNITREDTLRIEKFSCRMKNPVGETDSESVNNPFYKAKWGAGAIVGFTALGVGVFALIAGGVGLYLKQKSTNSRTVPSDNQATSSSSEQWKKAQ